MAWWNKLSSSNQRAPLPVAISCDMHSHLLPGLDDGADNVETSLRLIQSLQQLGYTKAITTPHIMGDFFKNTSDTIHAALTLVQQALIEKNIEFSLDAAAEYYLDEWFMDSLEKDKPLLTLGASNYVLFETSYINKPSQLHQAIFLMKSKGYQPVMAHPERYTYMYAAKEEYEQFLEMGTLFQLNINSLSGYYSKGAKQMAEFLIDKKWVHFAGTDCHTLKHIQALTIARQSKYYSKLLSLPLLNATI